MNKVKLKYIATLNYGDALASEIRDDLGDYKVYGSNGAVGVHNRVNTKGKTIIVGRKGSYGKVLYSQDPVFVIDTAYSIDESSTKADLRWLYYVLQTLDFEGSSLDTGVPGLSREFAHNSLLPSPLLSAQKKMAKFIDEKADIIDKLLSLKNHTHTQLAELRTAIIADSILGWGTGMNVQHTNIPWIGDIPAHWSTEKIKGVSDIVLGKMLQSTEKDGYVCKKYLRAQNIRWERVDVKDVNEMWFSPTELVSFRLKKHDILVSEGGEVGRAAMWNDELEECYIQNSVNRLRAKKDKILPEYLLYVLESYGKAKVFENTVNRVSIAHLTREKLKEYSIPLPPLDEQREIVEGIKRRLAKIDNADTVLQTSINQLEEYRTSLISNVISGKVSV